MTNFKYAYDEYADDRESFYNFAMAFTKFNSDSYFEYDYDKQEYYNRNVEAAFQCWFHGFGYGYDKGCEAVYADLREEHDIDFEDEPVTLANLLTDE